MITSAKGGKILVEYTLNGVAMEDEMYCVIQSQDIPIPTYLGTYRNVNWYMPYLQSFRAEKGKLDSEAKVFQTISYFARTDVSWLNKYNQVVNYLIQQQIKQIESLGQLSNLVSQTSNEISDANYDAWEQSQNVKDRLMISLIAFLIFSHTQTRLTEAPLTFLLAIAVLGPTV